MSYELTGRIKLINNVQTFGSGFTKREFVVAVEDGKFPQEIALECIKDKTQLLDNFEPGQMVTVTFDIRGREYNGRYFNNLQAWRIEAAEDAAPNADMGENPASHAEQGDGEPF
ncbi:MAG: DUF3127 domain-containing protein [Kiritimatiellia bacterium]|jgi:single-strand DNA-binding protein